MILGDTWRDWLAAEAGGAVFVGVTAKPELTDRLWATGAALVVPSFLMDGSRRSPGP